jgi:hypothetical protein
MNPAHLSAASAPSPSEVLPSRSTTRRAWSRYFNPFRIATYLLALYALGHTLGAVVKTPQLGAESDEVVRMMKWVHVRPQGADCTWFGFYRGFGALISVYFVFSAVLTWQLGGMSPRELRRLAPVTWALFASYIAGAVVSWLYFFPAPIVFGTATAVVLGLAVTRRA